MTPLASDRIAFDERASQDLTIGQSIDVPAIVAAAGDQATYHFFAFFISKIENTNTRSAYARQVRAFCTWCEQKGVADIRVVRLTGIFAAPNATTA